MKKILILFLLAPLAYGAKAQNSTAIADTILVGSIEKNCPGGFDAFNMYIEKNAHPAAKAYENKKVGTTYVSFIIEPDGSVSNVCTILAAGYGMDEEAIRVISNSNNWIPAKIGNKPVRCFCRAAIQFSADYAKHETWITAKRID
ncbi:MAG TPA: energy transducer TonB [Mucilaginibacter sp.]|nr:energy transducer TonB [Mucilaginibacter sp.]